MTKQNASVAETMDAIFGEGTAAEIWSGDELAQAQKPHSPEPIQYCKHVLLKITGSGQASLQHPHAALGTHSGVRTVMITEAPLGVPASEVCHRYNVSVDSGTDVAYRYDSLGTGRILR